MLTNMLPKGWWLFVWLSKTSLIFFQQRLYYKTRRWSVLKYLTVYETIIERSVEQSVDEANQLLVFTLTSWEQNNNGLSCRCDAIVSTIRPTIMFLSHVNDKKCYFRSYDHIYLNLNIRFDHLKIITIFELCMVIKLCIDIWYQGQFVPVFCFHSYIYD